MPAPATPPAAAHARRVRGLSTQLRQQHLAHQRAGHLDEATQSLDQLEHLVIAIEAKARLTPAARHAA